MIVLRPDQLGQIAAQAEAAYPAECCGLLVGQGDQVLYVTQVVPADNLLAHLPGRFEIAPRRQFEVMRALRGGSDRIIGHYHSHPDHPAEPSACDLAMAYDPDMIWLITSVVAGRAANTTAHRLTADTTRFRPLMLKIAKTS